MKRWMLVNHPKAGALMYEISRETTREGVRLTLAESLDDPFPIRVYANDCQPVEFVESVG